MRKFLSMAYAASLVFLFCLPLSAAPATAVIPRSPLHRRMTGPCPRLLQSPAKA